MIKLKIRYYNDQTDIRFPCTEKALQEALAEIDAEQVRPLELYVTEVVFPEELDFLQYRFANLDEVNYLAKRMDSFFGDEEYQFYEAMKLEGFDTLPDLINLSFNLNRYPLIRDIGDMGKIGREYLLTVNGCIPAHDEDDPKYAQLGRELIQSGNGIFTEHGMLCVDENTPFQRSYDGQTFPPYLYDPGVLCVAKAEYGGKTEYLYFPCEEEAIDKAFARLGTTADEVKITLEDFNTDSPEWFGRFREIASEEGVYELNRLTAAVNTADMDLKKLWSVAEYAEAEDAEQLTRLAKGLFLQGPIYFDYGTFTTFGQNCYANFNFTVLDICPVNIGDNVFFGPNCTVAAPVHPLRWQERNIKFKEDGSPYDDEYGKPVTIHSNCWIASNVTIIGGVTIGEGCVIGAGSVVTRDIPPHSLAAGNPCKVIRQITEKDSIKYRTELF